MNRSTTSRLVLIAGLVGALVLQVPAIASVSIGEPPQPVVASTPVQREQRQHGVAELVGRDACLLTGTEHSDQCMRETVARGNGDRRRQPAPQQQRTLVVGG
ncbi:hypothetical protein C1N91_02225 [Curtobacterium sp. SGAir0471]|uniref:hypothetical protein n=1 Tax=Curtobacterium sp. SGAir0471 TaxID=2070337 RepID=UPI0010CCFB9C|nr:hypothetical protein [Curtobacterium sp. SGAir0471]QCR42537.1 hypothetical protein C1N91_02225 [Curtobacterium sp. SGAir0471]